MKKHNFFFKKLSFSKLYKVAVSISAAPFTKKAGLDNQRKECKWLSIAGKNYFLKNLEELLTSIHTETVPLHF